MRSIFLLAVAAACVSAAKAAPAAMAVHHDEAGKKVTVTVGGDLFTEVVYNTYSKPILWPVRGPGGASLTRDWPMKSGTPGEDSDHPHHKSLWFAHGSVNGVDFWKEGEDAGTVVTEGVSMAAVGADGVALIELKNKWFAPGGKLVCRDTTTLRCGTDGAARFIDYTVTVAATEGPLLFGDTKEGTMAIRTRPELNLEQNPLAAGQCVNSEGIKGKAIWGQKARWVDYWAPIGGKVVGVAIFDHPQNLRHPTTWHAREYGLIAVNPFGLHDFSKSAPKGAGDFALTAGATQTWRYRFLFHEGSAAAAAVEDAWKRWSRPAQAPAR